MLTVHLQTELGLNIYEIICEVRADLIKTGVTITDAYDMISDIHRKIFGNHEGSDDRRLSVSDTDYARHQVHAHCCSD